MKQITIILCLLFAGYFSFSQNKLSAGVYAEGGYFFPKKTYSGQSFENNTAYGGGGFLQYNITSKFAAALQVGYRYKSNENTTRTYTTLEDYDYGHGSETEIHSYKQHYLILPLKLSYLLTKKLSVEAGVEAARILNYDQVHIDDLTGDKWFDNVNHKTEFDCILGVGYSISPKIKASLNYIQGFKEQGMGSIRTLDESYGQTYKNRMLMVNLSYSLFGEKQHP